MHASPIRRRLALPRHPEAPAPFTFPLLATLAPVGVSGVVFAVTQSPLALVFAALGPVIAVGSVVDARIQSRRTARREAGRFARETIAARAAIRAAHDAERAELEVRHPTVQAALDRPERVLLPRWLDKAGVVPVVLGRGEVASTVAIAGETTGVVEPDAFDAAIDALAAEGAVLHGAPVVVDAVGGIGLVGSGPILLAAARAIIAHIVSIVPPTGHGIEVAGDAAGWDWLDTLPLVVTRVAARSHALEISTNGEMRCLVAVAAERAALPGSAAVVVSFGSGGTVLERRPGGPPVPAVLAPVLLSEEQARCWALELGATARRQGLVGATPLAGSVAFAELATVEGPTPSTGLRAVLALGAGGPVEVDLVGEGPHAIVGGTTGSGKSELLISWVLGIARRYGPAEVAFLLVDFKGGSSFGSLAELPHCVGVLTDLDESTAERALESLSAELRLRERTLARLGARSIDDAAAASLPRLVIVVDEFAAMVAGFPELHALVGDIAARGRSLGVHLILCTQRPAGVIRDAVLANSAIRVSLRVHNRADSVAVVGTDDAALLPASIRGRAVISLSGEPPRLAQVPLATAVDTAAVAARWPGVPASRRPWLDPLPAVIAPPDVSGAPGRLAFGVADNPAEQSQPEAVYEPARHGNLLVVGGSGSGRSTALAALGRNDAAEWLPSGPDAAWDAVSEALALARSGTSAERVLLLDDLDVVLARLSADHRAEFIDRLCALLREGPPASIRVVVALQRLSGSLQSIAALCGSRLVLALPDRQEHLLAGGDPARFRPNAPPGAGSWQGLAVQVYAVPVSSGPVAEHHPPRRPALLAPSGPVVAVSPRPRQFAERLAALGWAAIELATGVDPRDPAVSRGGNPAALVADPATWQSHFGLVSTLRQTHTVLVEGCSVAEFRAVTGCRELPPPIAGTPGACWVLEPDGTLGRAVPGNDHSPTTPDSAQNRAPRC